MTVPVKPLPADDLAHVLAHTRELWAGARGQSFFITGGTGFFGLWLLESFAHANDSLRLGMNAVVLTRDPAAFARKAPHLASRGDLQFVAGDMRDFKFPAGKFTHVVHAATEAKPAPAGTDPQLTVDFIVEGTRRVIAFATAAGAKKFLLTSSGAVYGVQPPDLPLVPEDFAGEPGALTPATAYGIGKRSSEELCQRATRDSGLECKIARCFAFVGPHLPLDAHFAVGNFLRDALAGKPIQIKGDGTPLRSYLHAADLTIWLWTMLFSAPAGRAYNVGSDQAVSIAELARTVAGLFTPDIPVRIARAAPPGASAARYVPATARAAAELGLREHIGLAEALVRTHRWHAGVSL